MREGVRNHKNNTTCTFLSKDGQHSVSKTHIFNHTQKLFPVALMNWTLQREPAERSMEERLPKHILSGLSYSPAAHLYPRALWSQAQGLFRWCCGSATEGPPHVCPGVGVTGAAVLFAATGKGVFSSNAVAICMVIYTAALCPPVIPKKPLES